MKQTSDNKPVFIQIKEWIEQHILRGEWSKGHQLPSVRELSAEFGVNPNTIARTYERLTMEQTIYSVRGVGYFVSDQAKELIETRRREEFRKETIPQFIADMNLLGIDLEEFIKHYNKTEKQ